MKASTGALLKKLVRHLFGILRAFEEWVHLESADQSAAAETDRDQASDR